jgi:hypothetical protein
MPPDPLDCSLFPRTTHSFLRIVHSRPQLFAGLLAAGIEVPVNGPASIHDFCHRQLDIPRAYLEARIQSVFLDRRPVEGLHETLLRRGHSLTVSAARAGFYGAILRRHRSTDQDSALPPAAPGSKRMSRPGPFLIHMQLASFAASELAGPILRRGVALGRQRLRDFLSRQAGDFWTACGGVILDARPMRSGRALLEPTCSCKSRVVLRIEPDDRWQS